MITEPNNVKAEVHNIDTERDWLDGLAAIEEQFNDAPKALARAVRIGKGLVAGRSKCPANQDFNTWLNETGYRSVGDDERKDSMWLFVNQSIALPILNQTRINNASWGRRYIRETLPTVYAQCQNARAFAETSANAATTDPTTSKRSQEAATTPKNNKSSENTSATSKSPTPSKTTTPLTDRSAFHNAPRAEEIATVYQNKKVRSALSRIWRERGGKQAWELIVTALDGGLLVPNNFQGDEPSIALLFPLMPYGMIRQYDIMNQKQRPHIRDVLLPAMIVNREKLIANPERTREIIAEYERDQRNKQQQSVATEKRAVAVKSMPSTEQELVMFGQTVWPRIGINQGEYDYDQVRAAIWTFRDYESWNKMAKEDTKSHAMRIRNSMRYLSEYMLRNDRNNPMSRIYSLISWFSFLMEKNPTGECKWPPYPHVEGQW